MVLVLLALGFFLTTFDVTESILHPSINSLWGTLIENQFYRDINLGNFQAIILNEKRHLIGQSVDKSSIAHFLIGERFDKLYNMCTVKGFNTEHTSVTHYHSTFMQRNMSFRLSKNSLQRLLC